MLPQIAMNSSGNALLPVTPRVAIRIRPGVPSDVPFMDSLQKMHSKQVGFFPTAQFEGNIKQGRVLIAEEVVGSGHLAVGSGEGQEQTSSRSSLPTGHCQLSTFLPVGYVLAADRYFKHDDVGIIYQMNVKPGRQRSLVGAMLLKAQFERSAYGCKLYCCWCAQDIAANRFWEAMGFVPLAFRTGSAAKARIHIFWQKRIRSGDETTPWWFPSETSGGAVKENRIVLPIPPGTHWSDAKPLVLPGVPSANEAAAALPGPKAPRVKKEKAAEALAPIKRNGLSFDIPQPGESLAEAKAEKPKKEPKPKVKNDPQLVAAARELRDRWLDQVNRTPLIGCGKYEVSRTVSQAERSRSIEGNVIRMDQPRACYAL